MTTTAPTRGHSAADFLARNRGGGLFTETVSQRIGAHMAAAAERLNLAPTVLTLTNLVIGLTTSVIVTSLAGRMAAGGVPSVLVGLLALLAWQVAYALDCADGQLARVTGQSSPAGARIDVLSDVALQISLVTAVVAVAQAYRPQTPVWIAAVFAGTWMVNLVTSVLQQGTASGSLVTSRSPVVRVIKLVRDYGAVVTCLALVIAFIPQWTVWVEGAFTLVNAFFLIASIVATARTALR